MKRLVNILTFLWLICIGFEANATYRETDFSPFPLSVHSETLLNGYWESNGGYLEIVEVEFYSINDHSWFIIHEVSAVNANDRRVMGFIFFDSRDQSYKRVFWTDGGVRVTPFVLYRLEDNENDPLEEYCLETDTYMLKLDEEMFIRSECGN